MAKSIKKSILLFLLLVFFLSGRSQEIIQVEKDAENPIYLSHIADKITTIALSSFEVSLGNIAQVNKDKEDLFISDIESNIVYRFNEEGELINFIGLSELKQEEGYNYTSRFCLDTIDKKVFLLTDKGLYIYSYDGIFINKKERF